MSKTKKDNKVRKAYDVGYAHGWDHSYDIPNGYIVRVAAVYGYSKGLKYRKRSDKNVAQRNRRK